MHLNRFQFFSISAAFCFCLGAGCSQSKQPPQPQKAVGLSILKTNLEATKTRAAYDSLHFLLVENYSGLTETDRRILHETLEKNAIWSSATTCPATEPGTKLTLRGHLTDETGKPLPGERIHVFHTNNHGFYAPTDSISGGMAENDPRIEGFLVTDSAGGFEVRTIRPASYPKQYRGRTIPQHVHFVVAVTGFRAENFQVVFADDPAMTDEHWVSWAKKMRNPIVNLRPDGVGVLGEVRLVLLKN